MKIGSRYQLVSDSLNIILQERHINEKRGKEYWTNLGYFGTPQNALKYLADLKVRESGFRDLVDVAKTQEEIYKLIEGLNLTPHPP